ncbi:hypothetical protein G7Y79_00072g097530 [Physcia stellaris]|nr:hypothetical protein G7Y79_00072g097530 [Physcia stellaris]
MTQLKELKQNDESLGQYYRRTYEILRGLGGQDKEKDDDDAILSLSEITVLDHVIEKFVNGLNDRQLRCKMRYKYLATSNRYLATSEWNLYGAYEAAEQISSYITSKKQALENEFEKKLSTVMQTQGMAAALKFAMNNQPEPYTRKPESIPVDRIERYRSVSPQHKKAESTFQNTAKDSQYIVKEDSQPCEVFATTTAQPSELKSPSYAVSASKLNQPHINGNSSDSNVSASGRIPEGPQTTSHPDSSISENVMTLPSHPEPICDSVSNEQAIRPEEPAERDESTELNASGPRKWPASTTLPEISVANESPPVLEQRPYQMQEKCSVSSTRTSSTAHTSKPWLTRNWRARPSLEICTVYESPPVPKEIACNLSESCNEDIRNTPGKSVASESPDGSVSMSLQKSLPEASIVDESPPFLEQTQPERPEISIPVDVTNIESFAKSTASESTILQKPSFETSTVYESSPTLKEMPREFSEISAAIENTSDTESMDEVLVSESRKWAVVSASFQKSSPKVSIADESLSVLEQMPCDLPEINAAMVDISDTESKKGKILASETSNWNAATTEKEVFDSKRTLHTFSKNSSASCSEDTEMPAAVDMLSLENLTNKDGLATGAFDSVTEIAVSSKNPTVHHTENTETWEKDSIYVYELPALPAFDLSIDIDFEAYTTDSVTYSSTRSPSSPSPPTPPVTMQVTEATSDYGREQSSTCSADYATSDYGREQSSTCSAELIEEYDNEAMAKVYHATSCYEGEQDICFVDTISDLTTKPDDTTITKSTITKPVVHHALLAYCLAWIRYITMPCMILWTLYDYITLFDLKTDYKARPKVKIKRSLKSKHIESRSQQTVAGIFAESTYKIALFSGTSTMVRILDIIAECTHKMATFSGTAIRVNTSGIFGCFAYKMASFSGSLQGLETFNFEVNESAYDFVSHFSCGKFYQATKNLEQPAHRTNDVPFRSINTLDVHVWD